MDIFNYSKASKRKAIKNKGIVFKNEKKKEDKFRGNHKEFIKL